MIDLAILGGLVITMDEALSQLNEGAVLVRDGVIEAVCSAQEGARYPARKVINATNCLVMPGLINGHTHLPMALFRGYGDDLPLLEWLFNKIFPLEAKYINRETVYHASLFSCLELIRSGITTVSDAYFFEEEVAKALSLAGIRGIVSEGILDFPTPTCKDPSLNFSRIREFLKDVTGNYPMITPMIFCHSPLTCKESTLKKARDLAKSHGIKWQIHLAETKDEFETIQREKGKTPLAYLESLGLLDSDLIAVHGVHLAEEDLEIAKEKDVAFIHCPESNMKLASGIARVSLMLKRGIRLGIGTDSVCSNNNLDLFREMDTAAKLQKVIMEDATALGAREVLQMATAWGALALGIGGVAGSLEKGKKADIIVIDLDSPHLTPFYDPYSLLVYSARSSDVRDVIVDGKVLMENREILTLDQQEITKRFFRIVGQIT